MSQAPLLEVRDLVGGYSTSKPVLHGLSFTINPGEIVALIGLNGAGKSTTMKHLLGLLHPKAGQIRIKGRTLAEDTGVYRSSYAYVPESPVLFEELTGRDHLEMTAMAYDIAQPEFRRRMEQLLDVFDMEEKADQFSRHLSKGMRQKVMIMSAFLAKPDLYIIDEPFLGLDPLGIRNVLKWMQQARSEGAGILMSSHILSMIEQYGDRFMILHRGRMLADGSLSELQASNNMPATGLETIFYAYLEREGAL